VESDPEWEPDLLDLVVTADLDLVESDPEWEPDLLDLVVTADLDVRS
jgi:hypothetical protein